MTKIKDVLEQTQPSCGKVKFIAIDGHGGSGKSTLAAILSKELSAEIIHTDDFASWDNPKDWWPLLIERIFDPIRRGAKTLSYPRSKWWDNHNPEPVADQQLTEVMILEGVSALRKEFRPYISLSIFVDTPKDTCIERGINRDLSTGKSYDELTKIWEDWYQKESTYMDRDRPKDIADFVIDGTKSFSKYI